MPISPEWWDGATGPFRDNSSGEITAATLRQFSQHLSDGGTTSGWFQFSPEPVELPGSISPDPVEDRGLVLFTPEVGMTSIGYPFSQSEENPGSFLLPSVGWMGLDVGMRGLVTLTNLPEGTEVLPLFVFISDTSGVTVYGMGSPVAADADGAVYVDASRRVVVDTDGGAAVILGVGIVPLGAWGDPAEGDEVGFTNPDDPFDTNFSVTALAFSATGPA